MALLSVASPCLSEISVLTSATTRYEVNSNLFALQPGNLGLGSVDTQRSDTYFVNTGALQVSEQLGRQRINANLAGSDINYRHFSSLNHSEYNLGAGFNWRLGQSLDGALDVTRWRRMVSFTDVNLSQLLLQTEQLQVAHIGIQLGLDERLEIDGRHRQSEESLPGAAALHVSERSAQAALLFGGRTGLTSGLSASYLDGNYTGVDGKPTASSAYRQSNAEIVAKYKSSRASFNGHAGYTRRSSTVGLDNIAGLTGELNFIHQITRKTSLELAASRYVSVYHANTGSELDNVATVNVRWQATNKIGVVVGSSWTYRKLPQKGNAPPGSDRIDHVQLAMLRINYVPLRWLTIRPYADIQSRTSNFVGANFNATVYGVSVAVQWENRPFR